MITRISQSGITLVEVVVAISIVTVSLVTIGFSVTAYVDARSALLVNAKAAYLGEEGYEILRALRDENWNTIDGIALDTTKYLAVSTTTISVTSTPEIIDTDYTRSFIVHPLYRNGSDDIVSSTAMGAVVDDDGREVEINVVGPTGTTTFEAILTNLYAL
jgi:type II secretory pathway pseudopilin PulG